MIKLIIEASLLGLVNVLIGFSIFNFEFSSLNHEAGSLLLVSGATLVLFLSTVIYNKTKGNKKEFTASIGYLSLILVVWAVWFTVLLILANQTSQSYQTLTTFGFLLNFNGLFYAYKMRKLGIEDISAKLETV